MKSRVVIGLPEASLNGVTIFSINLVRGLLAQGIDAHILLTEEGRTGLMKPQAAPLKMPADIPVITLPGSRYDSWYNQWQGLIRYLEEQSPCIYLPNHNWRMSGVSARLSDRVRIVGIVHTDLALEYEHVARLGRYWNAIVGVTETIQEKLEFNNSEIIPRLVTIPYGVPIASQMPKKTEQDHLQVVYHGALRNHQKRITTDMLDVMSSLASHKIPVQLTLIGDGPARADIEEKGASLIEQGILRLLGVLPPDKIAAHLAQQDVYLLTSEYEGLPNAMLEAMGQGCVPVVSNLDGLSKVVNQNNSGYTVSIGDVEGFARHLADLQHDPLLRQEMARRAYQTVIEGGYRTEDMVTAYIDLFERVEAQAERGVFRRHRERFQPPPETMGGMQIFVGGLSQVAEQVNKVPLWPNPPITAPPVVSGSRNGVSRTLSDYQVVIAMTSGRISGADTFTINLARQLQAAGVVVTIVRTRPDEQVSDPLDLPDDLPLETLPVSAGAGWPDRWQAMRRYLAERSPCFYLPNYDWRHSCISPTLPPDVKVVGIAHSDDPQHYEHVVRLGRYWDGIVAVSQAIATEIKALDPSLADRLHTIPYGVVIPDKRPKRSRQTGDPLRLVYAGRLSEYQKRVLDLPQIITTLLNKEIPVELALIGSGPDQGWLLDRCKPLMVQRHILFLERLPNNLVLEMLADSDIFLLTSSFEGLPVGMLEAMGQGCVPVVSDVRSGVPEIIQDGVNGYRLPVGDIESFAERLACLYHQPELYERMAQTAYETVRDQGYRLADMTERYLACFETILTQNYHRPSGKILPPPNMIGQTRWVMSMPRPVRRAFWATRRAVKGGRS